jgi:ABC-type antimicrobial peptide transport system permease subunit
MFTDRDVRNRSKVCLIGETIKREMFQGDSPVGKEIRISNIAFRVIGVLSRKGANMMGRDQDDALILPWTTLKFRLSSSRSATAGVTAAAAGGVNTLNRVYPSQQVSLYPVLSDIQAADLPQMTRFADLDDIFVSVTSAEEVQPTIRQIRALLRERHRLEGDAPDDFRIRDLTEISNTLASTGRLMTNLLLAVAAISLVVGGVGIMNIMLASVTERTREIGLRMAVGGRPTDILRQFLSEAIILCFLGGVGGVALGRIASLLVTKFLHWPTLLSLPAIAASLAVSVTVGVTFGYYPAWKASRLDPIEALRWE